MKSFVATFNGFVLFAVYAETSVEARQIVRQVKKNSERVHSVRLQKVGDMGICGDAYSYRGGNQ